MLILWRQCPGRVSAGRFSKGSARSTLSHSGGTENMSPDDVRFRDELSERGVEFKGKAVGVYYGVVDSQRGSRDFLTMR